MRNLVPTQSVCSVLLLALILLPACSKPEPPPPDITSAKYWKGVIQDGETHSIQPPSDFPLRKNPDPRAIPAFIELCNDESGFVRWVAIRSLRLFGKKGGAAVPTLLPILKDRKWQIQTNAAVTLGIVASPDDRKVIDALQDLLKDGNPSVQCGAAEGLISLKRQDLVIPTLISIVDFGEKTGAGSAECKAVQLLARIGPEARKAVPLLTRIVATKPTKRFPAGPWEIYAVEALTSIDGGSKSTEAALKLHLNDKNAEMRFCTCQALWKNFQNSKDTVSVLGALLMNQRGSNFKFSVLTARAEEILQLFSEMKSKAKPVLPLLKRIRAETKDPALKNQIEKVVKSIAN